MTYEEAERRLLAGRFITHPGVKDFWYLYRSKILCFTYYGCITECPIDEKSKKRKDWEITNGNRDKEGALVALTSSNTLVKQVKRITSKGVLILLFKDNEVIASVDKKLFGRWIPTEEDEVAKDYIIVNDLVLKLDEDY